jgi:hypothetical protein
VRTCFAAALMPFVLLATGCPSAPETPSQYPKRAEGCDIKVFPESPPMQTDNIGPVQATCAENVTNDDCMRTLKDEACKLGADVVWGVSDVPTNVLGKKRFSGRAAHTKTAGAAPTK